MLVFCLESLTQGFETHVPVWAEFDEGRRRKIDTLLRALPAADAEKVRAQILKDQHLANAKRFREFVHKHVRPEFYTKEAATVYFPMRPSELTQCLKGAYAVRSKYAHALQVVQDKLAIPDITLAETITWQRETYPTYRGLYRLLQHVFESAILQTTKVETEDADWKEGLPGIVTMEAAPKYWISKAEGYGTESARAYFSGHLNDAWYYALKTKEIAPLHDTIQKALELYPQTPTDLRVTVLNMVMSYRAFIKKPEYDDAWREFLDEHEAELVPSIDGLAVWSFHMQSAPWPATESARLLQEHKATRHQNGALKIPRELELLVGLAVANQLLAEGQNQGFAGLLKDTLLESAGLPLLQESIQASIEYEVPMNLEECRSTLLKASDRPKVGATVG